MKKSLKIIRLVLLITLILVAVSTMLMQLPAIQTWLGRKAATILSEKVDATISLGALKILPFNTVILENVVVIDDNPRTFVLDSLDEKPRRVFLDAHYSPIDTVLTAERLNISFTPRGLAGKSLGLNRVVLKNARMNLVIEDKNPFPANLSRMFATKEVKEKWDGVFYIRTLRTENVEFVMKNYRTQSCHLLDTTGINWNDLNVDQINIRAKNIRMQGKVLTAEVDFTSFRESRLDYIVNSVSGKARVGEGLTLVEDFKYVDEWSELTLNSYSMEYDRPLAFKYYLSSVKMAADIASPMTVDIRTLQKFAPSLPPVAEKLYGSSTIVLTLKGQASGTVDDLKFSNLQILSERFSGSINGRLQGLPKASELRADLKLSNLSAQVKGERYRGSVALNGSTKNAKIVLEGVSENGRLSAKLQAQNILKKAKRSVGGTVVTSGLDVKTILKSEKLPVGKTSLTTTFQAHLSPLEIQIDSLKIREIELFNRDFEDIRVVGLVSDGKFDGSMVVSDPKLELEYDGEITYSAKSSDVCYDFVVSVPYADLSALALDKLRDHSIASFNIYGDIRHNLDGGLRGSVELDDARVETELETYKIGDVLISTEPLGDEQRVVLDSDFLYAELQGYGRVKDVLADIKATLLEDVFAQENDEGTQLKTSGSLKLKTKKTSAILAVVAPGKYIAEGSTIDLSLGLSGDMRAQVRSQRIASRANFVKDLNISLDNTNGSLLLQADAQNLRFASMDMFGGELSAMAESGIVDLRFSYDNQAENSGTVEILSKLSREGGSTSMEAFISNSYLTVGGQPWEVLPSIVSLENKVLSIDNFALHSNSQSISVNGKLSRERSDTLDIRFHNCDIAPLNHLLPKDLGFGGELNGIAKITSDEASRGIITSMDIQGASIAQESLGQLNIHSYWNNLAQRYDLNISNSHNINLRIGYTIPSRYLEAKLKLDDFSLKSVAPFVSGIFSEMDGIISGDIGLIGPIDDLNIRSLNTQFKEARLCVAYTNVPYTLNGPFHLNDSGAYFDQVEVRDRFGNKGVVTGKVGYNRLRDVSLDVDIDVNSIEIINKTRTEPFYGHLFGTGHVDITGPLSGVNISAAVTTSGAGEFHVPLKSQQNAGSTNLLKFKEIEQIIEEDPYETMLTNLKKQKKIENNFAMKLSVETTPLVEVSVEVDMDTGNVLRGRGNGNFDINVKPSKGLFDITGDYSIDTGNYHFVLLGNLVARDFSINEGSSIRFNGDIMNSTLNIDASYKTKASLSSLISDTTSTSIRRTVECGIAITEKLSNPRLSFSINIPDLDPTINAQVESALSTDDKVQKQFLALLISNSFIPDEQSSIVNSNSTLFSNISELMANQLNTIFQKLDIPLDLGLNYQQTDSGNDVFDVAVSTQLFNNRVVINGNIGNRQYHSTTSGSEIAGDLDVEIKLDRPGSFKLTLFSHSADAYTNYLDDSQRNGVGVSYQTEFNNFGQWVRRLFMSKARKAAEPVSKDQEMVDIKINANE